MRLETPGFRVARRLRRAGRAVLLITLATLAPGCAAHIGTMKPIVATVAPTQSSSERGHREAPAEREQLHALFGDTLIGFQPGTADSSRRFLGRMRGGYTADTLNVILCGDNRPGYRSVRIAPELTIIRQGLSPNPLKIGRAILTIPLALLKGLVPDLALIRDIPAVTMHMPKWGREHQVMSAMLAKIDSLHAHGQDVAAVVNSGDLVEDGRRPAHWQRFLRITRPLASRVPYFAVAGNHERTDTPEGIENWRVATGLPATGNRLYYSFDTADGWLRFIALDSNPIVDPGSHWTRQVQVQYSQEEFSWLVARVKEHVGPVVVMMHHPPFSSSAHRDEWQRDAVLQERRTRMVQALHEAGISIIVSGHEHAYQRALLTWPDAVLIAVVSGGGGAPLHDIPPPQEAARLFSEYKVAGSVVKPQNVFTAQTFNFSLLRLWFGGGELYTYSVDNRARPTQIDQVSVDVKRYGVPKIDQHKIPIPPTRGPKEPMKVEKTPAPAASNTSKADTSTVNRRLLTGPKPGRGAKSAPAPADSAATRSPR